MITCKMLVFKPSGKFYTEEIISLPDVHPDKIKDNIESYRRLNQYKGMIRVITIQESTYCLYPFIILPNS